MEEDFTTGTVLGGLYASSVVTRGVAVSAHNGAQGIANVLNIIAFGLRARRQRKEAMIRHLTGQINEANKRFEKYEVFIRGLKQKILESEAKAETAANDRRTASRHFGQLSSYTLKHEIFTKALLAAADAGRTNTPEYRELKAILEDMRSAWHRDRSDSLAGRYLGDRINALIKTLSPTAETLY